MKGDTHALIGAIVYFAYLDFSGLAFTRSSFIAAILMALLPDIDTPYSTISRTTIITRAVSERINVALGHRGPLHSLFFRSVITVLLRSFYTSGYMSYLTYAVASLGYLSHLVADAFTPKGVPLFRPIEDSRVSVCKKYGRRRTLCIKTGGYKENALKIPLTFVLLVLVGLYLGLYPRDFTGPPRVLPERDRHDRGQGIVPGERHRLVA